MRSNEKSAWFDDSALVAIASFPFEKPAGILFSADRDLLSSFSPVPDSFRFSAAYHAPFFFRDIGSVGEE